MKISNNKFVSLSYDLNVGDGDERELMEKATEEQPLNFLFGMGMMLESFEKELFNLQKGDQFSFTLSPEKAYGEREEDRVVELPKQLFEIDGKFDSDRVSEGQILPMMDQEGNRLNGAVLEIKNDVIVMDFNHPLAGENLHFSGKVLDVHEPSAEEIASFSGGGCSGGCSGCGDDDGEGGGCGCGGH